MKEVHQRVHRILLIQSGSADAGDLQASLQEEGGPTALVETAPRLSQGLERLSRGGIDVVLLDLNLPDSEGLVTFERCYAFAPDVPIVVLTETDDSELGMNCVQGGAQDYLVKGEVGRSLLARSVRYAMERHRLISALRSLSLIDDLTGLYNRRGFSDLGEQHLRLARRTHRGGLLVFCDVDRFKDINDSLGHHVGDRALLKLAEILRAAFRGSDIIARLGGDEFAVLALEVSGEDQQALLKRLRQKVHEFNALGHEPYQISLSIGSASFGHGPEPRLDDLLARADADMYEEKRAKRERVRT